MHLSVFLINQLDSWQQNSQTIFFVFIWELCVRIKAFFLQLSVVNGQQKGHWRNWKKGQFFSDIRWVTISRCIVVPAESMGLNQRQLCWTVMQPEHSRIWNLQVIVQMWIWGWCMCVNTSGFGDVGVDPQRTPKRPLCVIHMRSKKMRNSKSLFNCVELENGVCVFGFTNFSFITPPKRPCRHISRKKSWRFSQKKNKTLKGSNCSLNCRVKNQKLRNTVVPAQLEFHEDEAHSTHHFVTQVWCLQFHCSHPRGHFYMRKIIGGSAYVYVFGLKWWFPKGDTQGYTSNQIYWWIKGPQMCLDYPLACTFLWGGNPSNCYSSMVQPYFIV